MSNDLEDFVGDVPERASLVKKRAKVLERLDKLDDKARPLRADLLMYDEMILALDKRIKADVRPIRSAEAVIEGEGND